MVRTFATFLSEFPDDSEEDGDGDILVPGGRAIAQALAAKILSAGAPRQHEFYGWKFEFKTTSNKDAWVLIQQPGPWLLTVESKAGWFQKRIGNAADKAEAVDVIRSAIEGIEEISSVSWFTEQEFEMSSRRDG